MVFVGGKFFFGDEMQDTVKEIMRKLHESWDNKPCKIRKAYFDKQKNEWIYVRDKPKPQWLIASIKEGQFLKRKRYFLWKVFGKFVFAHLDNVANCLRRKSRSGG